MKDNQKLVFYAKDGTRTKTKREYLLQKLYLLELKKREKEGLLEYEQTKRKK